MELKEPDKKAFHSFRHSFTDALRDADVAESISAKLLGHSHPNITYGLYGGGPKLKQLQRNIEKINYNIPALEILRYKP